MEVVIDQKGEETVIKIKGRLDTNTARECEEKVLPVWENPGVKVCVDCSDLEYHLYLFDVQAGTRKEIKTAAWKNQSIDLEGNPLNRNSAIWN